MTKHRSPDPSLTVTSEEGYHVRTFSVNGAPVLLATKSDERKWSRPELVRRAIANYRAQARERETT